MTVDALRRIMAEKPKQVQHREGCTRRVKVRASGIACDCGAKKESW